jgi:hypothetical protein
MTLLPDGSLVVTSLGGGTSPGTLYRYDTETGDREDLLAPLFSGNFDLDANVDGDDLLVWGDAFGDDPSADADGDGDSDGSDFLAWQRGLGGPVTFSPSGVVYYEPVLPNAAGIPEPSAGELALVAIAAGGWMRLRLG